MTPGAAPRRRAWAKPAALAILTAAAAGLYWAYGDRLEKERVADLIESRQSALVGWGRARPFLLPWVAWGGYTVGAILPIASFLTLAIGWYFRLVYGPWLGMGLGLLVVSFGSTAAATLSFLASRFFLGDAIRRRFPDRVAKFDESLKREGPFYLFALRLIPAAPFWLVNVGMGLTPIRVRTYWWVSQLGMLPGTAAFVFVGSQLPGVREIAEQNLFELLWPGPLLAFALLAALPWAARFLLKRFRPESPPAAE
ncbi:TVP38/TMEM64 family protein [Alienimonas sp. DA493]|uniref:TVP38/TMEM64 family protein n=1 Tax=Alienimonas sp. DA493 TaxID=3373605 RepID=UPI0037544BE0